MKNAMVINAKAIVSSRGQVVIPRQLRDALGLHSGSELTFKIHDGVLEVKPVRRSINMLFGRGNQKNQYKMSIQDIDKAIMAAVLSNDENTR